jgi:hypothetical protein
MQAMMGISAEEAAEKEENEAINEVNEHEARRQKAVEAQMMLGEVQKLMAELETIETSMDNPAVIKSIEEEKKEDDQVDEMEMMVRAMQAQLADGTRKHSLEDL